MVIEKLGRLVHKWTGQQPIDLGLAHLIAYVSELKAQLVGIDLADILLVKTLECVDQDGLIVQLCEMFAKHGQELSKVERVRRRRCKVRLERVGRSVNAKVRKHRADVVGSDQPIRVGIDHVERFLEPLDLFRREGGIQRRRCLTWMLAYLARRSRSRERRRRRRRRASVEERGCRRRSAALRCHDVMLSVLSCERLRVRMSSRCAIRAAVVRESVAQNGWW